jgi:hypothetical protein
MRAIPPLQVERGLGSEALPSSERGTSPVPACLVLGVGAYPWGAELNLKLNKKCVLLENTHFYELY